MNLNTTIKTPIPVKPFLRSFFSPKKEQKLNLAELPIVVAASKYMKIKPDEFVKLLNADNPDAYNALCEVAKKNHKIIISHSGNSTDFSLGPHGLLFINQRFASI